MKEYKLGVGPMSREIIDSIYEYGKGTPIMVVASRNQVDYNGGYVCSTRELGNLVTDPDILLCRDHCGPYFKDTDKNLSLDDALEECKKTIKRDISSGFDLIHVDVSRINNNQLAYAEQLFNFILDIDPTIQLEFGSEDNTGEGIMTSESRIDEQLEFISKYKDNVRYFVTQTGSFTKHTQVGSFDAERNKSVVDKVHSAGFMFKEHNADYLSRSEVMLRRVAGIDALNIAPQLGSVQTRILMDMTLGSAEWREFSDMVYSNNIWKKWVPINIVDKSLSVIVAGHYHFNTTEYQALMNIVDIPLYKDTISTAMNQIFDCYIKE